MEVTSSFYQLLCSFQPIFTNPTFPVFVRMMTGWVLSHRRRFVTDLIWSSGSVHKGHFTRYHRFFSQSSWELDAVSKVLAVLVVTVLVPTGLIWLAVDDTLCRKRGLTVFGTGMHHDPLISSRARPLTSWGHDWVVVTLILRNPFWSHGKVWSLPLVFCLYRNRQGVTKGKAKARAKLSKAERARQKRQEAKRRAADPAHRTRPELAVQAISLIAGWFPDRQFVVTGDSAYGGKSVLSNLPSNVDLISHVHPKGALYEPPPGPAPTAQGKKSGRPRKKGARLPGLQEWADDASQPWKTLVFDEYGLHATLQVKFRKKVLYYKSGGQRLLNVVLTRDTEGKRPAQMYYCTRLDWTPRQILSCYAARWSIEVCFENAKQLLGFEDPANRVPKAVERTAPMSLVLYSLCILWFHQEGHAKVKFPERPWYTHKTTSSFADILCTLRRESFLGWFSRVPCRDRRVKKKVTQLVDLLSLSG
jgi:hypothetical protein